MDDGAGNSESVNQIPAAPLPQPEPQHQHTTDTAAVSPPLLFVSEIPEQPTAQDITEIEYPAEATPTEAHTEAPVPLQEVDPAYHPTDTDKATQGQAIEADPLASVPAQLLADLGEVRKAKKRSPKVTKTEANLWWAEAQKCGWDMQQVVLTMILHGWARFKADWVQNLPAHVQPGTPSAPKCWEPEPYTPASPSTVAKMREQIAAMKARWNETPQTDAPMTKPGGGYICIDVGLHVGDAPEKAMFCLRG